MIWRDTDFDKAVKKYFTLRLILKPFPRLMVAVIVVTVGLLVWPLFFFQFPGIFYLADPAATSSDMDPASYQNDIHFLCFLGFFCDFTAALAWKDFWGRIILILGLNIFYKLYHRRKNGRSANNAVAMKRNGWKMNNIDAYNLKT